MRVMPYTTARGAILLGNVTPALSQPDVMPTVQRGRALDTGFDMTSGDTDDMEPSALTSGVERSWVSVGRNRSEVWMLGRDPLGTRAR